MRQFILEKQKIKDGLITLDGKDYKYLRQVLRAKVGQMISVRLPDGTLQNSTVAKIDENSKTLVLQICAETSKTITRGVQANQIESKLPSVEYWLFQFLPKPQKFEQIVKQATECGVSNIIPVIGEYTEKSSVSAMLGTKAERLERIIREARQQSGSPVDTKVSAPVSLEEALNMWKQICTAPPSSNESTSNSSLAFVLSERDDGNTLYKTLSTAKNISRVGIAVGSEGGISPSEVEFLEKKGLFHPVHFAVNILRCETAAIYGIATIQSFVNEIL